VRPSIDIEAVSARSRVTLDASAFSGRDAARFGTVAEPPEAPSVASLGPVAVVGLVAAAWVAPEAPRTELLTAAALLGAALAARRPASTSAIGEHTTSAWSLSSAPTTARPSRLTDDELRDALAAW